jgi:hypothetical protein
MAQARRQVEIAMVGVGVNLEGMADKKGGCDLASIQTQREKLHDDWRIDGEAPRHQRRSE